MKSMFFTSAVISVVFLMLKFIETKFVLKEDFNVKSLFRETLVVYISVLGGRFLLKQFYILNSDDSKKQAQVFTGTPGF